MAPNAPREALRLSGITRSFGPVRANDDISFAVAPGEVVALLGENGAGKTTLMNILFGHYVADAGQVEVFGRALPPGDPRAAIEAGIGMVHQHFTLAENLTVLENITLGTGPLLRLARRGRARAHILELGRDFGLAVTPDQPVAALSVGERQRVEILKALYREARVLILDEPTAVLTPMEADALFATLRRLVARGLSVIFISHKLHEVLAISDRVVVLRHGRVAGTRAVADTSREDLTALMVGAEVAPPQIAPARPGPVRLALRGVSTRAAEAGPPLQAVDLELRGGEITGLAGVSGNGQAALAALIAGSLRPVAGRFEIDGAEPGRWSPAAAVQAGIARIPEDRHALGAIDAMSITENVISERVRSRFSRRGLLDRRAARAFAAGIITAYDVRCPGPEARIGLLSGGNMQKLILGRALAGAGEGAEPAVILANQPVRGLDIGAVSYVHARLLEARARGAAILLISEDLDEVRALSDRIHVISEGRLSPPSARGALSVRQLGALMAGQGFAEAADAS
ncbi:ABC transporter ATP-binding protein [Paroceanicella profunda]|uniref:ABC transporter ATP-binding protein n=1 Tax=Paroceanicella profunda TaxID=2579971 RepID=A0A5B8FHH2_9RHOB|nr:ABC transporter ATP-binding protein [Paroceanicella profunda]QDL92411.1 ABC transporter ATP-binding protein [Paroceanicella profunda]